MITHASTIIANANDICVDGAVCAETPSSAVQAEQSTLTDADVQRIAAAVCERLSTIRSDSRYWSPERAAYECSVSERTFAEWMSMGKVSFNKVGRRVLIDPKLLDEELAKYLQRRAPKRRQRRQPQTSALATAPDYGLLDKKAA